MSLSIAHGPVPPIPAGQVAFFLMQLGALLGCAVLLGRLARRLGMPAVIGELLTGVLLGPTGWFMSTHADQTHLLDAVSQLGAVLLVGITGAHLDTPMVFRRGATVARVGIGSMVVPLTFGVVAGYFMPKELLAGGHDRTTFAMFLGVTMAVSAVPVIAKTLTDMHLLHRNVGQLILASAAIQDAAAWFLLSLVSAMAVHSVHPGKVALSALYLVGFVAVAAVAGRPLVRRAMRLAGRSAEPGPSNATAVAIILLSAAASQALGLEAVFGALVAGVLIGSAGVGTADAARLSPLRTITLTVLAPIFLASAGLRVDLSALAHPVVLAAGLVILTLAVLGKYLGAYAGARLSRMDHWEGIALGAGLNARGVVEIIIAMVGLRLGVLTTATYTIVVLVAVFTSIMAPPFLRWAMKHAEHNAEEQLREAELAAWNHSPHS